MFFKKKYSKYKLLEIKNRTAEFLKSTIDIGKISLKSPVKNDLGDIKRYKFEDKYMQIRE